VSPGRRRPATAPFVASSTHLPTAFPPPLAHPHAHRQLRETNAALAAGWVGGVSKGARKVAKALQAPMTRAVQQALEIALQGKSGAGPATSPCYALWCTWLRLLPDTACEFIGPTCDKFARKATGKSEDEVRRDWW
jgi:hypothetical protein